MILADRKWKPFNLQTIFDEVKRGKRLKTDDHIPGKTPYVSSTANNNAVDSFIGNTYGVRIFNNCLTIANSGSVGSVFYHPYSFIASDHVTELKKEGLSAHAYLFIATVANRLSEKYGFNREINDKRIRREIVMLPVKNDGNPDFEFMEAYMIEIEKKLIKKYADYQKNNRGGQEISEPFAWKAFLLKDIFRIESGKRLEKENFIPGKIPFVGASEMNNGITAFVNNNNISSDQNLLGVNYNGGVAISHYHPYKALFSDDVKRFHLKEVPDNMYVYLFMKQAILQQRRKFEYGYKFNSQRMEKTSIMLPITEGGKPDYTYMVSFMKNIESRQLKKYLDYKLRLNE